MKRKQWTEQEMEWLRGTVECVGCGGGLCDGQWVCMGCHGDYGEDKEVR